MLFSVAALTVTGLFHDVGNLLTFLSTLSVDVRFSLIHPGYITSSHNSYDILILFTGSFPSLSSVLNCGVFLHSFPFCTCADMVGHQIAASSLRHFADTVGLLLLLDNIRVIITLFPLRFIR